MLFRPEFLLLGSAGRNAGKTEFACEVIRRFASSRRVAAVKVTTVRESGGSCPRGGAGCGVCGSLTGPFLLTREDGRAIGKDTARMRAAGADPVFWLRVRRKDLCEGLTELLRQLPANTPVICESNALRNEIRPGLFLVLRRAGPGRVKASCAEVISEADQIVHRADVGWNLAPANVLFVWGQWYVRPQASAIVLAGGRSSRMGQDKSWLPFAGKPLIAHILEQLRPVFPELIVGAGPLAKHHFATARIVVDREPNMGPLMGVLSCLNESGHDVNFVTACDVPVMHLGFILQMLKQIDGYDAVVPVSAAGRYEPLFAVYRKTIAAPAGAILRNGGRRLVELFDKVKVRFVELPQTGWYRNLNTPEEYLAAAGNGVPPPGLLGKPGGATKTD